MGGLATANLWEGYVERLSSAGNAMVKAQNAEPLDQANNNLEGEVNIGPLPREAVGERVTFLYKGGVFGVCLNEQWVSQSYLEDVLTRVSFSVDEMELYSTIIDGNSADELSEGTICTAIP